MKTKLLIAVFSVLTLSVAVGSQSAYAQEQPTETQQAQVVAAKEVIVQPGDSLSKIAKANGTTYTRLFDANTQIANPDVIHPGEKVRIPSAEEVLASRAAPVVQKQQKPVSKPVATTPAKKKAAPANYQAGSGVWDQLAKCESGGNWSINTGNGYYGGLQFSLSSWKAVGGSGYPNQASREEQISRAEMLKARQGWGAWPSCTKKMGLR